MKPNENKPPRNAKDGDNSQPRKKREYRKRHRPEVVQRTEQEISEYTFTSDDEELNDNQSHSISDQDEDDSDGPFTFKRKKGCQYHAPLSDPLGNWPFYSAEERVSNNLVKKYCLTEIRHNNQRYFEYTRRRIGRGGRIILDKLQLNSPFNVKELNEDDDNSSELSFDYYRAKSPSTFDKEMDVDEDDQADDELLLIENDNLNSSIPINVTDYLNENDVYIDRRSRTDDDLARFRNHQKELIEIQRIKQEKLSSIRKDCESSLSSCSSTFQIPTITSINLSNCLDSHPQSNTIQSNHNYETSSINEQTIYL